MSNRYKGGIISATPPTTTGGDTGTASGAWTLEQQMQAQAAGNWPIQPPPLYIENVFQTWLYTGNGATQTITNGINITGKGALVWIKARSGYAGYHILTDTARGAGLNISSNVDIAQYNDGQPTFNSNGFNLLNNNPDYNASGNTYVSWTFREQAKFFDIVTYTGDNSNRTIAHNLGSAPGCIIIKSLSAIGPWPVYHRGLTSAATSYLNLDQTSSRNVAATYWNSTAPTSTVFSLGTSKDVNRSGTTYVAYLFAHNAGGFGPTETDNVITCGSFTSDGSGNVSVDLGWEPQWILTKRTNASNNWQLFDNMRGMTADGGANPLAPNTSDVEANLSAFPGVMAINATGFSGNSNGFAASSTFVYIAIRRGPMAVPTTGTSVFSANFGNNLTGAGTIINSSMLVDMFIQKGVASGSETPTFVHDRLRGAPRYLQASGTNEELSVADWRLDRNTGVGYSTTRNLTSRIGWMFRRAPQFFDEVCYTGNDVARNLTHNLGAVPELWIVKIRSASGYSWAVGGGVLGSATNNFIILNSTSGSSTLANFWATPTTTTFGFGSGAPSDTTINQSGQTYVSYLFASCPGVSKVGSYTGTGATQVVNCGFAAGARFVMIKATSTTGDWYVWDSTRGIVAGNDPYLEMNTADPEVTGTDWVDTAATGFELSNAGGNLANSNGVSYIFLAIA